METQVPFQLHNIGFTKTTIKNNNKTTKSSIEWKGKYDGEIADIHILVNNNGRNEDMNIKLNNDDLMNLFGHHVVEQQIDDRLVNDFFSDRPIMPFINNGQSHLKPLQKQTTQVTTKKRSKQNTKKRRKQNTKKRSKQNTNKF